LSHVGHNVQSVGIYLALVLNILVILVAVQVHIKRPAPNFDIPYADDVNVLGGNVHAVQKNIQALVAAANEIGLEVNADKTKYMAMSRD
jgi:hypothetical protein